MKPDNQESRGNGPDGLTPGGESSQLPASGGSQCRFCNGGGYDEQGQPCKCALYGPVRTQQLYELKCQHDRAWDWVHEENRVCHALWDAGFAGKESAEHGAIMVAAKQICIRAWMKGYEAALSQQDNEGSCE